MARAGRKPKAGKREPNGQISRRGKFRTVPPDRGSAWVAGRRDRFGPHYNWALGRAYAAGLLDDPVNDKAADERLQVVCRFVRLHARVYGTVTYGRDPLDDSPRVGNVVAISDVTDHDERDRDWLRLAEARANNSGGRPFLDQMLSSLYVDQGPAWLDRLIEPMDQERRIDFVWDPRNPDRLVLDAAIKAIDAMR